MSRRSFVASGLYDERYYRHWTLLGQQLAPSLAWEGDWQADPSAYLVNGSVYVFYSAHSGAYTYVGYASCSIGDYIASPANLVKPASYVIAPSGVLNQADELIVTAQQLIRKTDGSGWHLYAHGHNSVGHGNGLLYTCSELEFPSTWHYQGVCLPVGGSGSCDEMHAWPQAVVPPWEGTSSGLWEMFFIGIPATTYPITGCRAYSSDGITWTKDARNPVALGSGQPGTFDQYSFLPLGKPHNHDGVWYGTYQGYNNETWCIGAYATRDFVNIVRRLGGSIVSNPAGTSAEGPSIHYIVPGRADMWYCKPTSFSKGVAGNYHLFLATCQLP